MKDSWSTAEQMFPFFYSKTVRRDRFFHILRFLNFSNSDSALDNNDLNCDRIWKLRHIFDFLNAKYSKYYIFLKGRIIFKKLISKGHMCYRNWLPAHHLRVGFWVMAVSLDSQFWYREAQNYIHWSAGNQGQLSATTQPPHTCIKGTAQLMV
jgi:hypothetical protein